MARKEGKKRPTIVSREGLGEQRGLGRPQAGSRETCKGYRRLPMLTPTAEELVEEGQATEAEAIADLEDAPGGDSSEVHTRQSKLMPCTGALLFLEQTPFTAYCVRRTS
jgi:hypothetical protein